LRKIISSNDGVAAVEFALISPLLFVLLFGIIEFSALLYNQAVITNASREASRYTATFYTNPANATAERPTCEEIQSFVSTYVKAHFINFTSSTPFGPSNVSCPDGSPYKDYSSYAGYVDTIKIDYTYGFLVLGNLIKILVPGETQWSSIPLSATTVMRDENQGT